MSFLCFKCQKKEPPSKETGPIVKKPKCPSKTRRSQRAYLSSAALESLCVDTSLSDLSPPPPCLAAAARSSEDDLSSIHYNHNVNEIYPESFLIYQPNTPMQFFMELSGTSDDYPAYDYPTNNRLLASLEQGNDDAMAAHDALAPDELHPINEEPLYTEQYLRSPCTQSKLKNVLERQGTPPLPRTSKRLSLWVPAVTSGCYDAMKDAYGNPRPCSLPQYVNFKGRYAN